MLSLRNQVTFVLVVTGMLCVSSVGWAQTSKGESVAAQPAAASVPAATDVAKDQAIVTYESAQLTIKAQGTRLIEVLRAVCSQIGAELDASSEPDEPVFGVFGPGPARDVLAAIMGHSHYNLAMAGSPEDPNAIRRIVIVRKSADSADKTNNGSDAPATQDSVAQNQRTEQPESRAMPAVASRPTAADVEASISQVREFFAQAQGELSQVLGGTPDMEAILKQAEAQAKAAVAADPNTPPPVASSTNRPRMRSRHTH